MTSLEKSFNVHQDGEAVARSSHSLYKDIKCLGALFWSDKAEFGRDLPFNFTIYLEMHLHLHCNYRELRETCSGLALVDIRKKHASSV